MHYKQYFFRWKLFACWIIRRGNVVFERKYVARRSRIELERNRMSRLQRWECCHSALSFCGELHMDDQSTTHRSPVHFNKHSDSFMQGTCCVGVWDPIKYLDWRWKTDYRNVNLTMKWSTNAAKEPNEKANLFWNWSSHALELEMCHSWEGASPLCLRREMSLGRRGPSYRFVDSLGSTTSKWAR